MVGLLPDEFPFEGQPAAVQAAFLKLRDDFVAGLPQRWADIKGARSDAVRHQALHRLAGAAGSYGFNALGQAARAAAQALTQPASAENTAAFQSAWQSLRHLLDQDKDTV